MQPQGVGVHFCPLRPLHQRENVAGHIGGLERKGLHFVESVQPQRVAVFRAAGPKLKFRLGPLLPFPCFFLGNAQHVQVNGRLHLEAGPDHVGAVRVDCRRRQRRGHIQKAGSASQYANGGQNVLCRRSGRRQKRPKRLSLKAGARLVVAHILHSARRLCADALIRFSHKSTSHIKSRAGSERSTKETRHGGKSPDWGDHPIFCSCGCTPQGVNGEAAPQQYSAFISRWRTAGTGSCTRP